MGKIFSSVMLREGDSQFALSVFLTERVLCIVYAVLLPNSPQFVYRIMKFAGKIIPVFDVCSISYPVIKDISPFNVTNKKR